MIDINKFEFTQEIDNALYIVGTPIGNLEDITLRALHILNEVDLILCEDTRRTSKLLSKYNIRKKLISCNGYNEKKISEKFDELISDKKVAYVSDSGTPGISDPGEIIVNKAHNKGVKVVPIPGPSALSSILSISGYLKKDIHFFGFLPVKKGKRKKFIEKIKEMEGIVVLYESPFRIRKLFILLYEMLGDIDIVIGRELTKIHEEVTKDNLKNIVDNIEANKEKGEYVICLEL
jgi:16S rRNA (cytidine1402-2'-O)-methyltransferase